MSKTRKLLLGLRLRHKFAFSLVVAALLPVIVAYWVGTSVVLRGLERGLRVETERQLHVGVNLLLRDIERLGHEAIRLAAAPDLEAALRKGPIALADTLGDQMEHLPSALVQIADDRGVIQVQRVVNGGVSRFEGIGATAESPSVRAGLTYERRVTMVSVDGQLVVRATAPIVDERFDLRGVIVMSVPLDGLFADSVKASLGADVLIFGGTEAMGTPLVSFLDPLGARVRDIRAGPYVAQTVYSGRTAYENSTILGHDYALGYAPIFEIEGNIVGIFGVAVDREAVLEARGAATRSLGLGAAGAFVFALGLAGLLSRRITRPLQHLHRGAIAIARGDLDHTISAAEGDEIGDLATAFSHMTTALKENQRRLAARMREIVALHDAGRAVSSVIEPEQVLRKVVDSVARVLHVRICALWLVESGSTGKMVLGAARAKRDDMRVIADRRTVEALVEPLVSIAEHVAEARQSLRINSTKEHKVFSGIARDASIDGSLIGAILERKGVVVGVIIIGRGAEARPFSDADANLLSTFADQAASAIENASLYAEVRKFNEELEAKVALRTVELQAINNELGLTIKELQETQAQLILSERLAGLGQLVAGVAHEINSPSAAIRGTADTLAEAVRRLTARQPQLEEMTQDGAEAKELVAFFERVAPALAEGRRVPPAVVRRAARELKEKLVEEGVEEDTAAAVAKPLAELDVDVGLSREMTGFLRGKNDEAGRFIVGYLADYVYIHRSTLTIQDAIRRIQRIVGSLKGYSHLDQEAARTDADIHEGIENTLVILDHQMARGIRVVRNFAALPGVPVFVDELNQVWTNLIHNALQAIEADGADGEINIETEAMETGVSVRIIDNGPGIPDDVMSHIFEPFFTTKPQGEGTGLGLGIVQQIVGKHDGTVRCTSEPGRTCFEVWLPIDIDSGDASA